MSAFKLLRLRSGLAVDVARIVDLGLVMLLSVGDMLTAVLTLCSDLASAGMTAAKEAALLLWMFKSLPESL